MKFNHKAVQENQVMVTLKHPNIVDVYSAYFSSERDAYIMVNEWCEYGSLARFIKMKRDAMEMIPEEIIRVIMVDLTTAVEHIHSMNYIHCDIRPENVFV